MQRLAKDFNLKDRNIASGIAKQVGAGVVLYGIGNWLSKKIAHMGIHASTGINLDWKLLDKVNEFPEIGQEKGQIRTKYPGIFDSADFPRKDKTALWGELEHGNIYAYEDMILKKAGYKDKQNAPNQTAWPLIRQVKVRTTALEIISKYIVAATGVALGSQEAFGNSFEDVDASAYYSSAVIWAASNQITAGTSATTFSPEAVVSRAQAMTFLYRERA